VDFEGLSSVSTLKLVGVFQTLVDSTANISTKMMAANENEEQARDELQR